MGLEDLLAKTKKMQQTAKEAKENSTNPTPPSKKTSEKPTPTQPSINKIKKTEDDIQQTGIQIVRNAVKCYPAESPEELQKTLGRTAESYSFKKKKPKSSSSRCCFGFFSFCSGKETEEKKSLLDREENYVHYKPINI